MTHSMRWRALAAVAVGGLMLSACSTADTNQSAGGGGKCAGKIAAVGALSGPDATNVVPSVDAAELALKEWSKDHPKCQIELVRYDSEGAPEKATPIATQIAGNASFLGVIGGAFSGESRAMKPIFNDVGLTMISQSATATDLTLDKANQVPVFHRIVPYDDYQGKAIAKYLSDVLKAKKVFVVDNSEAYGEPLSAVVVKELGGLVVGKDKTQRPQIDFAPTVAKIRQAQPDAIMYGGYIAEAAPFLKQIRDAGITAPFVGGDGLFGSGWGEAVGDAGEGSIAICPCSPIKADSTFATDFKAMFKEPPGTYAAEGYDTMSIFLAAIDKGKYTRADVQAFVKSYDADGLSKHISFDENGDVGVVSYWAYVDKDGVQVPQQEIKLD